MYNTYHDVTDSVDLGMLKNAKSRKSSEPKVTFLQNKTILNLCLKWFISRNYCSVAEVTFKL